MLTRVTQRISTASALLVLISLSASPLLAQSESFLRSYFEGSEVTLKIDMPAHKSGVDVYPGTSRPLDFSKVGERIRRYGISLRRGDTAMITLIRVKKKNIEFHLAGGGFSGSVSSPTYISTSIPESNREKRLEEQIDQEINSRRRRQLEEELEDAREARKREEDRLELEVELNRRLADIVEFEMRAQAGSRFNLWYEPRVPSEALNPEEIMHALGRYVEFDVPRRFAEPGYPPQPLPTSGDPDFWSSFPIRKGLSEAQVQSILGEPESRRAGQVGDLNTVELSYARAQASLTVKLVNGIVVSYTLSSH